MQKNLIHMMKILKSDQWKIILLFSINDTDTELLYEIGSSRIMRRQKKMCSYLPLIAISTNIQDCLYKARVLAGTCYND